MQILDDVCRTEGKEYFAIFNDDFSKGIIQGFGGSWIGSPLSVISKTGSILSEAEITGRGGIFVPPHNVVKLFGTAKILD
jgi:hypothetical protein